MHFKISISLKVSGVIMIGLNLFYLNSFFLYSLHVDCDTDYQCIESRYLSNCIITGFMIIHIKYNFCLISNYLKIDVGFFTIKLKKHLCLEYFFIIIFL